jgi:drug/metabolite transporter (DMT)-like permease
VPALLFAVASSLTYGCADFAGGLAARRAHILRVVAITAPASLAVGLLLLPLLGGRWSPAGVAWGAASGIASAAAFTLLYQCLSMGPMGVLSPITALVSAILPAGVGILDGDRLDVLAVVGIGLALIAVLLISGGGGATSIRPYRTALLLAVGAGAAIGASLICLDRSPHDSGVTPIVVGRTVSSGTLMFAFLVRRSHLPAGRPQWELAAGAGAMDSLANLAFLLAVRDGELAIVSVVTSLYPAGTVVLARVVLGERLARSQAAGLALAAAALALLALN